MSEHLIRLRGGWLWLDPQASPDPTDADPAPGLGPGRRVTLPLTWPAVADPPGRVRLVRSFGPPPLDPRREILVLRLAQVGGLASARLNGREIARPAPGTTALEVPLPRPLPQRNLLVLDVVPPTPEAGGNPEPWGEIALAIGPREDSSSECLGHDPGESPHDRGEGDSQELLGGIEP